MGGLLEKLLSLDRRWIFLLVLVSAATPILLPIGLPVTTSSSTRDAYEYLDGLKPGDYVWVSFDYGPTTAPENDPMAEAVMRQCLLKKLRLVVTALYPLGGLGLANSSVAKVAAEFPEAKYGVDYVNLGYKDGAQAVMRRLGDNISDAFPTDVSGTPVARIPMMQGLHDIHQVKLAFSAATGIIGEWWVTIVHQQFGTPIVVGPTAVGAPKYYAYLNAGQMVGMLSGMKGAAEYEKLLRDEYPKMATFYRTTRRFTATKGMDGQTVIHALIIIFVILGNVAYLSSRAKARRAGA